MWFAIQNALSAFKSLVVAEQPTFVKFCELPDGLIRVIFEFTDIGAMQTPFELLKDGDTREDTLKKLSVLRPMWSPGLPSTSKRFRQMLPVSRTWLNATAILHTTLSTHTRYQNDYAWVMARRSNPLLVDLLFSGGDPPFACHYTEVVDQHVRALVHSFPFLLESTFGTLRCRDHVTPLQAACINHMVPLKTVEFLMEHMSASCPHMLSHRIRVCGVDEDFLCDIAEHFDLPPFRLKALTVLFEKHMP